MNDLICEACGSNRYFARDFPRVRDESQWWQHKTKELAGRVAALELDAEMARFRDRTDVAWLQGKVVAQRREIKRLNDERNARLIRAGVDPQPDREVTSATRVEIGAP